MRRLQWSLRLILQDGLLAFAFADVQRVISRPVPHVLIDQVDVGLASVHVLRVADRFIAFAGELVPRGHHILLRSTLGIFPLEILDEDGLVQRRFVIFARQEVHLFDHLRVLELACVRVRSLLFALLAGWQLVLQVKQLGLEVLRLVEGSLADVQIRNTSGLSHFVLA